MTRPVAPPQQRTGRRQSVGLTPGEALDALTAQLGTDEAGTLVVIQHLRPDAFLTADQRQRLGDLLARWRAARDRGTALPPDEQAELDALVAAEPDATGRRAATLAGELMPRTRWWTPLSKLNVAF
jgi:hypothetical protein